MNEIVYLSVVIPICNEADNINELYQRLNEVMDYNHLDFEIIFVDDGSKDTSFKLLKNLRSQDTRIKIIKLARKFGQAAALLAGFEHAQGEIVLTMDGDLQNKPEWIPIFIEKIKKGFDLVSGWRINRNDSLLKRRIPSRIMNWFISKRTGITLHDYGCGFNAIKRDLIPLLKKYGRNARFMKPLLVENIEKVAVVEIDYVPREKGFSKYNLFNLAKTGLDFFINFSLKPKKKGNQQIFVIEKIIG